MTKELPRDWPANDRHGSDDITRQEYIEAMLAAGFELSWMGFWRVKGTDVCISDFSAGYKFKDKLEYMQRCKEKGVGRLNLSK